ncbi:unnamed protein product, partial [Effrenium voratum]
RNLGKDAAHEPVFQDDLHGPGASKCFPLFPGYWPDKRHHSFVDSNFLPSLGAKERKVRELFEKEFTPDLRLKHGVEKVAVSQQFHHSVEVSDKDYRWGMRNSVNKLQATILGWEE